MRRAGICLWMMIKRMGKHPVYWVLLLLFPTALFVVPKLNRAVDEEQILVGYVVEGTAEDGAEGEMSPGRASERGDAESEMLPGQTETESVEWNGTETGKLKYGEQLLAGIEYKLMEDVEPVSTPSEKAEKKEEDTANISDRNSMLQYIKYTGSNKMKEDIMIGELSCGIVFDRDFAKRLEEQDYRGCIKLYLPEGMNVGGMVQEDIFARVYQAYSAVWYAELLGEQGYQIKPEEVLQKFSEYQKEGKVFAVEYEEHENVDEEVQNRVGGGKDVSTAMSPRSVLAFLTFLSASLGALDGSKDRKRGAGKNIYGKNTLAAAVVGAPILLAVLFLAGGMISADIKTFGMLHAGRTVLLADNMPNISYGFVWKIILMELGSAVVYGLALWLLAMLFGRIIPEKLLEGMMPCFLLIAVLCCPIFFDLGENISLIGGLSKLFPVTWYLKFWG